MLRRRVSRVQHQPPYLVILDYTIYVSIFNVSQEYSSVSSSWIILDVPFPPLRIFFIFLSTHLLILCMILLKNLLRYGREVSHSSSDYPLSFSLLPSTTFSTKVRFLFPGCHYSSDHLPPPRKCSPFVLSTSSVPPRPFLPFPDLSTR